MNIIPNPYLIAIQFVPFLLAAVALYHIIFKPMLAYLDERSTMTDGAKAEAEALLEKVQAQLAAYESQLAEANAEVRSIRSSRRVEAMKVYNAKVDESRAAAEQKVNAALAEMDAEQAEARATLQGTVGSLADQIAGNILQNLAS